MSSDFGRVIRVSIFGQSHGEAIGAVIDGIPAGENARALVACHTQTKLHALAHLAVNVSRIAAEIAFVSGIGIICGIAIGCKQKIALVIESFNVAFYLLERLIALSENGIKKSGTCVRKCTVEHAKTLDLTPQLAAASISFCLCPFIFFFIFLADAAEIFYIISHFSPLYFLFFGAGAGVAISGAAPEPS